MALRIHNAAVSIRICNVCAIVEGTKGVPYPREKLGFEIDHRLPGAIVELGVSSLETTITGP